MACGVSILILLAGVISCSKDKHQPQSQAQPKTDKLNVELIRREYDGSLLRIHSTTDFGKTEADNIITFNNTPLRIHDVYYRFSYNHVFVPNPNYETISSTVNVTVGGKTLHAPYTIKPLFNKNDITQVKAFLLAKSDGEENIAILNQRNSRRLTINTTPEHWYELGIKFSGPLSNDIEGKEADHDRRLIEFDLSFWNPPITKTTKLGGNLSLTGCSHLKEVIVRDEEFTSIDLTGADPDLLLDCAHNDLTSITLSHPLKNATEINPQKTGALTTTDGLHYTLARP